MRTYGIGIVGTGNIAGGYAADILTHPQLRLRAVTDVDHDRAAAFATAHGCRTHPDLDALLANPEVDIVVNLTVHHAHYEVTRRALAAGRHVYSEKPLALRPQEARELLALAEAGGVRLGCSPSTFLGEAQQTAAAWIQDGRLGTVRAIYADVSWGRIETWHPAPAAFFEVGVMADVAVYPLTLATAIVGPRARSGRGAGTCCPRGWRIDGAPFRIGSPDLVVAAIELEGGAVMRLTASFYVGRPAKHQGGLEFHGDAASMALGSFQSFDAAVEVGPYDGAYAPVPHVRPPFPGIAWARGVAEMASSISEGRPHRASAERAAHIVDILDAAAASRAADGRRIEITSTPPKPLTDALGHPPARRGLTGASRARSELLEPRPDLRREPRHRLLVIVRGDAHDQVPVAERDLGGDLLDDIVDRAHRLVVPVPGDPVAVERRVEQALRLCPIVADEHRPDAGRALDLGRVAADGLAVAKEDLLLAPAAPRRCRRRCSCRRTSPPA